MMYVYYIMQSAGPFSQSWQVVKLRLVMLHSHVPHVASSTAEHVQGMDVLGFLIQVISWRNIIIQVLAKPE